MYCIYSITEKSTGRQYIGRCTNKNFRQRMYAHLHRNDGCRALWERVNELMTQNPTYHSRELFTVKKIVPHITSLQMAQFGERYLIRYFDTISPNGFNLWRGGENGRIPGTHLSEESKQKIGNTSRERGHYIRTEVSKKKTSNGLKAYYRTHSPQNAKRILDQTTGIIYCTLKEASASIGCRDSDISNQCAGRQKSVRGHIFRYL